MPGEKRQCYGSRYLERRGKDPGTKREKEGRKVFWIQTSPHKKKKIKFEKGFSLTAV